MLIDTHTHLYSEQFENDIDEVIARAKQNGVERFYLPAIDKSYTDRMLKLENQHQDNVRNITLVQSNQPIFPRHPTRRKTRATTSNN